MHNDAFWSISIQHLSDYQIEYPKVASTSPSHLVAHAGFFRLSMKGKFYVYFLWSFGKNHAHNFTVLVYFLTLFISFSCIPITVFQGSVLELAPYVMINKLVRQVLLNVQVCLCAHTQHSGFNLLLMNSKLTPLCWVCAHKQIWTLSNTCRTSLLIIT